MEMYEIVMKLIGPVRPTGDHAADQKRLANMEKLTELVDRLLFEIDSATTAATRTEASMKAIGDHAKDFMVRIKNA